MPKLQRPLCKTLLLSDSSDGEIEVDVHDYNKLELGSSLQAWYDDVPCF